MAANRLRVLRAERRISQLRVAIGVGLGTTKYWMIESGYVEPTSAERAAIAQVLRTTEDVIWPPESASTGREAAESGAPQAVAQPAGA